MAQDYRIEKDSLGEMQVPSDALYGAQTQRAVLNFPVSGMQPYPAFVWAMATIKRAAAEVNADLGLLDKKLADAIVQAAQEVIEGKLQNHFVVDPFQAGAGTSHNMNNNEVIANRANQILGFGLADAEKPVNPNDHVNMAQSTNDTIPTAIRLGCLWRLDELLGVIDGLVNALETKAQEFDHVVKSGRTHLQDAVPVRLGQEFGAYARAVAYDRERIAVAGDRLRRLGIGGTATGSGLNAHPDYHAGMVKQLSKLTGQELRSSGNLFESMQSMADPADFSASMRTLCITLTRIANDFRLLSSGPATGLDEIRLPAVQPGSSIMPGKVNPVLAEMLNMASFHVQGCDHTVALSAQAGQVELNVMMPIIAHNLFEMMHVLIGSIKAFTEKCVVGVTANEEKAHGWLAKNAILVTALNPAIGYLNGAAVAKEAMASGKTIKEVVLEKGLLTAEKVDELLNVRSMTDGGIQGE
ncbi:MAG: aspartate ammonia-lyase [Chloroflexi bacterium AL-W]|nr:aspartate ammonia-lyase [Chloroflexi bacterium AL-N1]NOK71078.1 aspartate ammonia-lyase [Chloroflexi bacterium AL-N10]NOK72700.1 aspartate ammonia-lyase [Chloroflexi bacterium AL-N5]NOK79212.1 aspartate ammonia-lyase [Chloroflexi bacterium AL-W]NOK87128.1 aspartate ammonia-lyase [Chloroflexi bacterium AL-N15]